METLVPDIQCLYVTPKDEDGSSYIRYSNVEEDEELQAYVKQLEEDPEVKALYADMQSRYQEALDMLMGRQFHPWEGGEGKITTQYTISLLEMAKQCLASEKYEQAEKLLKKALVYPENLGEGKLEGTKDNHLFYHLGLALEAQGKHDEAKTCFETATIGTDEPAGAMYYNDQPADMILYQGLAFEKLGKTREAKSRFYRLIDYGEQHLNDEGKIEYFAVSLPDFLIFDSGESLLANTDKKDIVFLDIEMPGLSGIATGQELKKQNSKIIIFIVTSYAEYLDEAMRFHVFRYLSKPLEKHRLFQNMKDALRVYSTENCHIPIAASDIIYLEACNRRTVVHTVTQDYESIHTIAQWKEKLPTGSFFQPHRSFIVNFMYVSDFDHSLIYLFHRKYTAYLTRRKYTEFKSAYLLYLESMR